MSNSFPEELFSELERIIMLEDASEKCQATQTIADHFENCTQEHHRPPSQILNPGYPAQLKLVPPRLLKRRGINTQAGRNILMHAIAHIEFNAINLALDAAYRFRHQEITYYRDWLAIAADEARHFDMIRGYLNEHNCDYGDYPAHNGLWEMAVQTANDIVARMALVPRVLEARGLDVTPGMIERLQSVGDKSAIKILGVIYEDEIDHVLTGSKWFKLQCKRAGLEPRATFVEKINIHLHGELKGPFNVAARLQAGFDELELDQLQRINH